VAQLRLGDKAPAFALTDQDGRRVALEDFFGRRLLVYFYPKAGTSGCTTQARAVRDALPALAAHGLAVVGISPDDPKSQKRFDEKQGLGFPLLSDPEHQAAEAYGVWGEKKLYGRAYMGVVRSAFVVDESGRIAAAWYKISPKNTVPEALKAAAHGSRGR
jgi:peroxiredoxin Q/BCP